MRGREEASRVKGLPRRECLGGTPIYFIKPGSALYQRGSARKDETAPLRKRMQYPSHFLETQDSLVPQYDLVHFLGDMIAKY